MHMRKIDTQASIETAVGKYCAALVYIPVVDEGAPAFAHGLTEQKYLSPFK